jgi:hypothetical protein
VSPTKERFENPTKRKLTMVLTNGTPESGHQGGGVIKDTINVRGPGVDRSAEQVDISRFAVNGLAVAEDGEGGTSDHGRARGKSDCGVDNRDGPGL